MLKNDFYDLAENWLWNKALPLWSRVGVDRSNGGFAEALTNDGKNAMLGFKRTRVTCRQTYVFSHASLLGWPGAEELVHHGVAHLTGAAWLGQERGFARRVSLDREVLDDTPDLYDYAFVLFALAWAYRATNDNDLVDWMHLTADTMERLLAHPSKLGFWHDGEQKGWRQQNPHMHLLEAALAVYEFTGVLRFKDLAADLAHLFLNKLFDSQRGVLPEFFDQDWRPAHDAQGDITEPGHQFEWAWILNRCQKLMGLNTADACRRLIQTAEEFGVDSASGVAFNSVSRAGRVLDAASRTWPQTERIKAAAALYELDGVDPDPVFASSCRVLFSRHLAAKEEGLWIERFTETGQPVADLVPASTFYHLFLAFTEMQRIGSLLEIAGQQSKG